ncbi:MAG: hypothetical protein AAF830_13980 [Pseudomonadota bacterium]
MATKKPIETLRDGNLKASVWENQGEKGPYFTVTLAKTYKDEQGSYRDTQSFTGTEILRVAELGRVAYHLTNDLRREHYQSNDMDNDETRERSQAGRSFERSRAPRRTR